MDWPMVIKREGTIATRIRFQTRRRSSVRHIAAAGWFSIPPKTSHATRRSARPARCLAINPSGFTAAPARLVLALEEIWLAIDNQQGIGLNSWGRSQHS